MSLSADGKNETFINQVAEQSNQLWTNIMNEYNHHRVIERFVFDNRNKNLPQNIQDVFEKASDFTDSINAEWKYFLYHFYYDIYIREDNTIMLSRADENTNRSSSSMGVCGDFVSYTQPASYQMPFSSLTDEKEFFSFINDRPRSPKLELGDVGNQSDNVAFLHAMGAELGENVSEKPQLSQAVFEEHLRKCFSEYLFLEEDDKALFMLGIAMHGIMDSFTPSHMGFQHYTKQDMALHAQGDVIPIRNITIKESEKNNWDNTEQTKFEDQPSSEDVEFVPGQYNKDKTEASWYKDLKNWTMSIAKQGLNRYKGFNEDEELNRIEYEMLRIYLHISKLQTNNGLPLTDTEALWKTFKNKSLSQIKEILQHYDYSEEAYVFSDTTIIAMTEIYDYLSKERNNHVNKCYQNYKNRKETILKEAINKWRKWYNSIKEERESHLSFNFYAKEKGEELRKNTNIKEDNLNINPNFRLYNTMKV